MSVIWIDQIFSGNSIHPHKLDVGTIDPPAKIEIEMGDFHAAIGDKRRR